MHIRKSYAKRAWRMKGRLLWNSGKTNTMTTREQHAFDSIHAHTSNLQMLDMAHHMGTLGALSDVSQHIDHTHLLTWFQVGSPEEYKRTIHTLSQSFIPFTSSKPYSSHQRKLHTLMMVQRRDWNTLKPLMFRTMHAHQTMGDAFGPWWSNLMAHCMPPTMWPQTFRKGKPMNIWYLLANPYVKRFYVGCSFNPFDRLTTHFVSAANGNEKHSLSSNPIDEEDPIYSQLYHTMYKTGVENWSMFLLMCTDAFPPDKCHQHLCFAIERRWIRMLQPQLIMIALIEFCKCTVAGVLEDCDQHCSFVLQGRHPKDTSR